MFLKFYEEVAGFDGNIEMEGYGPWFDGMMIGYEQSLCGINMLWKDRRPIGFMTFNKIFDCILVVRNIFLEKPYRNSGLLRKLLLSSGKPAVIYSQQFKKRPVQELLRNSPANVLYEDEEMKVLEYKWRKHGRS